MTYDFIYANILRLGFEKENEENTLVHQLFVHKNCFLPLVHKHLHNPLYIELHGSPIDCTALGHHDFLSPHILSRLRPPATRETVANIRRVMHITERPPCNAKSKLVKLCKGKIIHIPIGSMYGIFPYIWLIFMVNVGKYTIHGCYGYTKPIASNSPSTKCFTESH